MCVCVCLCVLDFFSIICSSLKHAVCLQEQTHTSDRPSQGWCWAIPQCLVRSGRIMHTHTHTHTKSYAVTSIYLSPYLRVRTRRDVIISMMYYHGLISLRGEFHGISPLSLSHAQLRQAIKIGFIPDVLERPMTPLKYARIFTAASECVRVREREKEIFFNCLFRIRGLRVDGTLMTCMRMTAQVRRGTLLSYLTMKYFSLGNSQDLVYFPLRFLLREWDSKHLRWRAAVQFTPRRELHACAYTFPKSSFPLFSFSFSAAQCIFEHPLRPSGHSRKTKILGVTPFFHSVNFR